MSIRAYKNRVIDYDKPVQIYRCLNRKGRVSLQEIIDDFEKIELEIKESFDNSNLPKEVSIKWLNKFLTNIRLQNLK